MAVDKVSLQFLKGATVEYAEDLLSSSFRVCSSSAICHLLELSLVFPRRFSAATGVQCLSSHYSPPMNLRFLDWSMDGIARRQDEKVDDLQPI
jgi:hypothetical protein